MQDNSLTEAIEYHSWIPVPGDIIHSNFLCHWSQTSSLLGHSWLGCSCRPRGKAEIVQ